MQWFLRLFGAKNNDISVFSGSVDTQIKEGIKRRKDDLDSLKKYDMGEKEIDAPDLREVVRSL